jgi:D-alanyl-D-alanine carboxypeptidase/D-alanyl-D-alanine-endopeptidase (penicillin-binding protein 4)
MKKYLFLLLCCAGNASIGQTVKEKLAAAVQQLEEDAQLRHGLIGLSVVDTKTGDTVYEHNAQTGLAPASTQKILTSCAAFDVLGKNYRYSTAIVYKSCKASPSRSYFVIEPSCDPSFGSARFDVTKPAGILKKIVLAIKEKKITPVSAQYIIRDSIYGNNTVPGGWIWEDIGNYYGAAAQSLNWMENQYDIVFKTGKRPGDNVSVVTTKPAGLADDLRVHLKTGERGSGDNSIVFLNYGAVPPSVEGELPAAEDAYEVGASIADPRDVFLQQLNNTIKAAGISMFYGFDNHPPILTLPDSLFEFIDLYKHVSPPLDSLNYWFMRKSINLYGEALIKTMAAEKSGFGSTQKGVAFLKDFWAGNGIEPSAINICDGSGLSPQNRVTTDALVKALQYAKTRPWFSSFNYALPEYNGMKMKSGSIGGARAYAGYHTAKDGKQYTFSIIINNYDGEAADLVKKMFRLLDNLK